MVRRHLLPFSVSLITLTLSLLGVAWAATGDLPLTGALSSADAPRMAAATTGPLLANDHEGRAVLTAARLAPGQTQSGEVTITNVGGDAGVFSLAAEGAGANSLLSEVLDLSVLDVSAAAPVTVFAGTVAALDAVDLGRLDAGDERRYRISVTYPSGRPAALDNPLQGTSTTISLAWRAAGIDTGSSGDTTIEIPGPSSRPGTTGAGTTRLQGGSATAGPAARATPLKLRLTRHKGAVRDGALRARLSATLPAQAVLSGTVTVRGRVTKLRATRVRVAPARREVRVVIPPAVRARGAGRRAIFRLTLNGTAGAQRATVRRTLPVMLPRHFRGG